MTIKDHLVPEYSQWLKKLGKKCKAIRQELGLTQSKMSRKIGIDMKFYQDIEGGRRPVSTKTLFTIAQGMETTMQDLVDFE